MLLFYLAAIENHDNDGKFTEIYEKYEKRIFSIAYAVTKDYHDAEDASQNAFLAIVANIDKIDLGDAERSRMYIYKIAKNAAINILRKKKNSVPIVDIDVLELPSDEDVGELVEKGELFLELYKCIEKMPPIYRDALSLRYLFNATVKDVANALGVSKETAKCRLARGEKILRKKMEKFLK